MKQYQVLLFGAEIYTPAMIARAANHKVSWAEVLQLCLIVMVKFLAEFFDNVDDYLEIPA